MKSRHIRATAALIALLGMQSQVAAECVTIVNGKLAPTRPMPPPPVIRVNGAFCGMVFDALGPQKNSELNLVSPSNLDIVARARVDGQAKFGFPAVPPGKYRVSLPGFATSYALVELTSNQAACERPLYIDLVIAGECAQPSRITEARPVGK
jgi:hypothetical protein